jgi:DNA-binding NarL/FixJ family response regulator
MENQTVYFMIVDDHPISREGFSTIINQEQGYSVIAEAGSAEEALARCKENNIDFAIVDISLEGMDGIQLIKILRKEFPKMNILVVSMYDELIYAERALEAGARGYLMKKEASKKVIEAIRAVLDGRIFVSEPMQQRFIGELSKKKIKKEANSPIEKLSDREFEIFVLMGKGDGPVQIATKLGLSVKTVQTYRGNMKQKLVLPSTAELRKFAIQWIKVNNIE